MSRRNTSEAVAADGWTETFVGKVGRSGKDRENEDEGSEGASEHVGFLERSLVAAKGYVNGGTGDRSTGESVSKMVPFYNNSESMEAGRPSNGG